MSYSIRIATPDDAEPLLNIYAPYIKETAITMEYVVPSVEEFRGRIENTLKNYPYLVLENDGEILGYAYASKFHPRAAFALATESSIYLRTDAKGHGYGKALYAKLEEYLIKQNVLDINACIAYAKPDNTHLTNASIAFHEKIGYKLCCHFHDIGFKFKEWYDLVWMEKKLGEHTSEAKTFIPFPEIIK
ncbi:MAG: GNAT family N-acetyltransferase [Phascolarctobacterium sp.]|nr:GNAT family N-acetyltransferase [Phascolarctobacterium sp.]